jgi:hypothetical protein
VELTIGRNCTNDAHLVKYGCAIALLRPHHNFPVHPNKEQGMVRTLSVLLSVLAIGCSNPADPDPETDILSAHAEKQTVTLVNTSDDPVYFFVANRGALALLDWAICLDPARCTPILPHSTTNVSYSQIAAYQKGSDQAVVFHWRIVTKGSGQYDYDKLRELVVKLH